MKIEFLSELHTTPVPKNTYAPWLKKNTDKVALVKDFKLSVNGALIVVPQGYVTDGSSIPRVFWPLFNPWYTEARRASCVHDYIYSHLYSRFSRKFADDLFREIMLIDGASTFVANIFYHSVRLFGKGGW